MGDDWLQPSGPRVWWPQIWQSLLTPRLNWCALSERTVIVRDVKALSYRLPNYHCDPAVCVHSYLPWDPHVVFWALFLWHSQNDPYLYYLSSPTIWFRSVRFDLRVQICMFWCWCWCCFALQMQYLNPAISLQEKQAGRPCWVLFLTLGKQYG